MDKKDNLNQNEKADEINEPSIRDQVLGAMSQHRYDQPTVSKTENENFLNESESKSIDKEVNSEKNKETNRDKVKIKSEVENISEISLDESDYGLEKQFILEEEDFKDLPKQPQYISAEEEGIENSIDSEFLDTDQDLVEYEPNIQNVTVPKDFSEHDELVLESKKRKEAREKESSLVKKIVLMVISALAVLLMVFGLVFYRYWQAGLKPLDKDNKELVQVEIPIGTSNKGIGSILEKKKVIKSGLVFNYFVKTNNLTDFKGGYYQMSPDMELDEIAELLKQGGSDEAENLADARITVPEGDSLYQIAEKFEEKTKIPKEDFLKVAKDKELFEKLYKKYPDLLESVKDAKGVRYRLEGYLFPATYNYYQENGIEDLISQMVGKTASVMASKKVKQEASHLSTQELLTLASLVEKEGVQEGDRRKIAKVFLNRIEEGMPLQSDISIIYAMDKHKVHLSNKDTQVDSPYNLYVNKGFGPGPFNNPSEQAIDAVLNPDDNKDLYFLADITTHKVYFAETYEEHLKLKEEYIDNKK